MVYLPSISPIIHCIEFISCLSNQIIVTKHDLITKSQLDVVLEGVFKEIMKKGRTGCIPVVHVVSSLTGFGIFTLKQSIAESAAAKLPE